MAVDILNITRYIAGARVYVGCAAPPPGKNMFAYATAGVPSGQNASLATDIGATVGESVFSYKVTLAGIEIEQVGMPVEPYVESEEATISFTCAEPTVARIQDALNGASVSGFQANVGPVIRMGGLVAVTGQTIALVATLPTNPVSYAGCMLYNALCDSGLTRSFKKSKESLIQFTFRSFPTVEWLSRGEGEYIGQYAESDSAGASVYYVDATNGNDSAIGSSLAPWKTIAAAGSRLQENDTLCLKCGETWVNDPLTIPASSVVVTSYGVGALPVLDGGVAVTGWTLDSGSIYKATVSLGFPLTQACFENDVRLTRVADKAAINSAGKFWNDSANDTLYVRCTDSGNPTGKTIVITADQYGVTVGEHTDVAISNIRSRRWGYSGFSLRDADCSRITMRNCVSDWNGLRGFDLGGSISNIKNDVCFDTCVAYDNVGEAYWLGLGARNGLIGCTGYNSGKDVSKGYSTAVATAGVTISDNSVDAYVLDSILYDNYGITLDAEYEAEGARATGTIIAGNSMTGQKSASPVLRIEQANALIYNNVIEQEQDEHAVHLYNGAATGGVYFNTIRHKLGNYRACLDAEACNNITAKNNLLLGTEHTRLIWVEDGGKLGWSSDYNCFEVVDSRIPGYWGSTGCYDLSDWRAAAVGDAHSVAPTDALVVSLVTPDYHLQAGSAAKAAGTPVVGISTDIASTARSATVPSIGAYE